MAGPEAGPILRSAGRRSARYPDHWAARTSSASRPLAPRLRERVRGCGSVSLRTGCARAGARAFRRRPATRAGPSQVRPAVLRTSWVVRVLVRLRVGRGSVIVGLGRSPRLSQGRPFCTLGAGYDILLWRERERLLFPERARSPFRRSGIRKERGGGKEIRLGCRREGRFLGVCE